MELGGNKIRKLEFLMAEAMQQQADCIVTLGGIQSNHARATAVAATMLGFECHLVRYKVAGIILHVVHTAFVYPYDH